MKIAFFSTKPYDRIWFEPMGKEYGFEIRFYEVPFHEETVSLANGFDAVCIFVNDYVNADMISHFPDRVCIDQVLRFGSEWTVQGYHIGTLHQFLYCYVFHRLC